MKRAAVPAATVGLGAAAGGLGSVLGRLTAEHFGLHLPWPASAAVLAVVFGVMVWRSRHGSRKPGER